MSPSSLPLECEVVLAAVGQDGMALELASDALRRKFEIVRLAVQNNGMALEFASDNMRQNDELVQQAVAGGRVQHLEQTDPESLQTECPIA